MFYDAVVSNCPSLIVLLAHVCLGPLKEISHCGIVLRPYSTSWHQVGLPLTGEIVDFLVVACFLGRVPWSSWAICQHIARSTAWFLPTPLLSRLLHLWLHVRIAHSSCSTHTPIADIVKAQKLTKFVTKKTKTDIPLSYHNVGRAAIVAGEKENIKNNNVYCVESLKWQKNSLICYIRQTLQIFAISMVGICIMFHSATYRDGAGLAHRSRHKIFLYEFDILKVPMHCGYHVLDDPERHFRGKFRITTTI